MNIDIQQVKRDFDNGTLICRATIGSVIDLAMSAQPAPIQSAELAESIDTARAAGRAEAVAIIMGMDPEDPLSECIAWGENGDCGDHSAYWCTDKLQAVFKTDDLLMNMMGKAEADAMEAHFMLEDAKRAIPAQPIADVSAPTDGITKFDIDLMAAKFPLPETRYNGCGDGSEPLYTPEMMYAYAHQFIVAMAHARKPELDKALEHITKLDAAARAAAPVSGQAASIDTPEFRKLLQAAEGGAFRTETFNALVAHIMQWADSRPRSEDSRAEALEAVENIVLQQCTGMAAKDIRLSRILDAIRALATTAAPERKRSPYVLGVKPPVSVEDQRKAFERSGQAAQEQAAPALTDARISEIALAVGMGTTRYEVDPEWYCREFARRIERHLAGGAGATGEKS